MTSTFVNAAPQTEMLGVNDKSIRALVPEPEVLPQFLAHVYLQAAWGPLTPELVVGDSRANIYGEESFDLRKKWASHATVLSNDLNAAGNTQFIQRLVAPNVGPKATVRAMLDVLPKTLPIYERNTDGSFKTDADGAKIPTGDTVAGFVVKWVFDKIAPAADGTSNVGQGTQMAGDQVDGTTQSIRFPIYDLEVPHFGAKGNNFGHRLWAPTVKSSTPVDGRILQNEKFYPIRIAFVQRSDASSTANVVDTRFGEKYVELGFKPDAYDRNSDLMMYMGEQLISKWENLNDPAGTPPQWGPFGKVHVYDANIAQLLEQFYDAEFPISIAGFSDFTGAEDEFYRFNMVSGVSSYGVPYHSFQLDASGLNSVRPTENASIFASGASDGDVSEATLDLLVRDAVREYSNPNSVLMDTARYPTSAIIDSGFDLDTKYAMISAMGTRKDLAVWIGTHAVSGVKLNASQESSLGVALRTRMQMYPESDYFGTAAMRGVIVSRSGIKMNSQYTKRLPLTIDLAQKAAAFAGAGNGAWKPGFAFDITPLNQVTNFRDINVTFTPASVRNQDWAAGMIWVENFAVRGVYYPGMRTVYDNDTSVLTSIFTMMACVELQKVGDRARRQFSGRSDLTNLQLIERVNKFVIDNTQGRFDGRFLIVPETYITASDEARGFSWSLKIKLGAPSLKTAMTLSVESYRFDDLAAATA